MQAQQAQRVTELNFFLKKIKKIGKSVLFLLLEKAGGDGDGNNIVKSMCSGRNPETPKSE